MHTYHNVFQHGHLLEEVDDLIGAADTGPIDLIRLATIDTLAIEVDLTAGGSIDAIDQVEQGCLSGTVGADQTSDGALLNHDVYLIVCHQTAEFQSQILGFKQHQTSLLLQKLPSSAGGAESTV